MTYRHLPPSPALRREPCFICRSTGRYLYVDPGWLPTFEGACWRCDGLGYAWRPLAERTRALLAAILERLTRTPARVRTMALRTDRSGAKGDVT